MYPTSQTRNVYVTSSHRRLGFFVPIAVLFVIALIAAISIALFGSGVSNPFTELYLLPWIGLAAVVIAAPAVYLAIRGRFDLFHPLVFAAWSYFIPAFVIGGLLLASGLSQPYYLSFIPDWEFYLPLTLGYVALGFAGLTFGFALPFGYSIGLALSRRFPVWDWNAKDILAPGVLLLVLGVLFNLTAFAAGLIGYQRSKLLDTFDATLSFFTYFVAVSSFMLWYSIFRVEKLTLQFKLVALLLIVLIPYSTLLAGSRGGLIHNLLPIAMAFWLSGRRIKFHHGVIFGTVLTAAVLLGIVYGTTFRSVKGAEEQVNLDTYLSQSSQAFRIMNQRGVTENFTFALQNLAERMETLSSLGVVVGNYEKLEEYADDYGLAGNIWTYTWTAFIPRFIWTDKPIIADARAYSALYFDFGENSFAITPIGDLLRNYGPIGVPLGMALLGFVLRILYTALVDGGTRSVWRSATYYLLLVNVSYEGFYGMLLPSMLRLMLILLLCGFVINLMVRKRVR